MCLICGVITLWVLAGLPLERDGARDQDRKKRANGKETRGRRRRSESDKKGGFCEDTRRENGLRKIDVIDVIVWIN